MTAGLTGGLDFLGGGTDDGFGFDIDESAALHGVVDSLEQHGNQPFAHGHFIDVKSCQRGIAGFGFGDVVESDNLNFVRYLYPHSSESV